MGDIIEVDKKFFKKKAQQKKLEELCAFSSITEELQHYVKPKNTKYESEIYKQVFDFISNDLKIRTLKSSKNIIFQQEGVKKILFLPNKKLVIHFIFNKIKTPKNIQDEFQHSYLILTEQPKIKDIKNQILGLIE